jgi:hypothetical protein
LLGLDPRPVPPHAFFVGADEIAYAGFDPRKDGSFGLPVWARRDLPLEVFHDGPLGGGLKAPAALEGALSSLLQRAAAPVKEASLVLPDDWLRVSFTQGGDLPENPQARQDVLRFKLKRLVPYRVEDLRVAPLEMPATVNGGAAVPPRLAIGFAQENLLAGLEAVFSGAGIRIGQITSASLAALAAIEPPPGQTVALAMVEDQSYALAFVRGPEPLLHRHKAAASRGAAVDGETVDGEPVDGEPVNPWRRELVQRDLLLTRNFLAQQLGEAPVDRVLVTAPPHLQGSWVGWLQDSFEAPVEVLGPQHLPFTTDAAPSPLPPMRLLAPLLGAALREVP